MLFVGSAWGAAGTQSGDYMAHTDAQTAGDALLTLQAIHIRRERILNLASALMLLDLAARLDNRTPIAVLPMGGVQ